MDGEQLDLEVGRIVIRYVVPATGEPEVDIEIPGTDAVPLVIQLGMLELTRDLLLRVDAA